MSEAVNQKTRLVYICNPNNPTGTITPGEELWKFCEATSEKVPVFVDEAYLEFMNKSDQKSMVGLIGKGKDIIVSRTFSKVYGMAGLRVGYVVAPPALLDEIRKTWRSNMGLNITALKGAIAAIEDKTFVKASIEKNAAARAYVCAELEKMGFDYLPSQTSFVLFPIDMKGDVFLKSMRELGIGVRAFEVFGQSHCRVSIGTMAEMELFVNSLKQVLA